jgi:hypothetical protein
MAKIIEFCNSVCFYLKEVRKLRMSAKKKNIYNM